MRLMHTFCAAGLFLPLGLAAARPASAQELIQNGGFENGSLVSWQAVSQSGGGSSFYARPSGTQIDPYRSTVGPATGSYYAVSDQTDSTRSASNGSSALLQTFIVAPSASSVVLSFDMFVDNYNFDGSAATPSSLDYTVVPNQQARVDILSAVAGAFDTGSGDLANYYTGADPVSDPSVDNPHSYMHYSFDITPLVGNGGAYQLRFAEANNQDNLYQGIDNVSIRETAASAAPEPSAIAAWAFAGLGVAGLFLKARKRARHGESA